MLLTRQQLAAHLFAGSEKDGRSALAYLRVDPATGPEAPSTVWATNGHTLARVRAHAPPADEFPTVPTIPAEATSPAVSTLIPVKTAKAVLAALRRQKPSRYLPILHHVLFKRAGDTLYLAITDLESPQVWQVKVPDATFPNIEDVVPGGKYGGKGPQLGPFGISGHYLGVVAKYRAMFGTRTDVTVTSQGPDNPILFEWVDTRSSHEVLCLVMPLRLPEPRTPEPVERERG